MNDDKEIAVMEAVSLPKNLNKARLASITQKTPKQIIEERPGPGRLLLSYVEVRYMIF